MEEEILKQIDEAYAKKDLKEVIRLTGLPAEVIVGKRRMTRKERRTWYRENKQRLGLPEWSQLSTLN